MELNKRKMKFIDYMSSRKVFPEDAFLNLYNQLESMGFFTAPASIHHHGNYEGGLFEHSLCVTENLEYLTKTLQLKWTRNESPYIVGMFHDLCKCDNYKRQKPKDIHPEEWGYSDGQVLIGHGDKSVIMLQQLMTLTEEEILCIRWHMGFADKQENWNAYGQSVTKYSNVLWTHTADVMAARIQGV